ncbi:MAG: C40 family peptidase [Helicobacter sp.]|nr:C40 family peptidase [Helicobacter sp.]
MRIAAFFLSLLLLFLSACSTTPELPEQSASEPPPTYSVQVGSFKNPNNAWRFVDTLNQKGLDAFLFKSKQTYKVRFGNYATKAEATKAAKALKEQGFFDDFFVVAPVRKRPQESSLRLSLYDSSYGYIGVPYKWGGEDADGFDCSGLTHTVYRLNGISIPRTSLEQFRAGRFVSRQNLRVGDLVFFATKRKQINHVGIYVGNDTFIHAPSRGKTVREADLNAEFWKKTYKGSRRFF